MPQYEQSYESLFVGTTQNTGADIVVGVIYRPPIWGLTDVAMSKIDPYTYLLRKLLNFEEKFVFII